MAASASRASDLRFRVRFDKQDFDQAAAGGGALGKWKAQFTRWAMIKPMQGSEPVVAQRLTGKQPVLITVRYDENTVLIDPSWRAVEVRNDNPVRYYALKTAEDMDRKRQFITLLAIAGDADGGDNA